MNTADPPQHAHKRKRGFRRSEPPQDQRSTANSRSGKHRLAGHKLRKIRSGARRNKLRQKNPALVAGARSIGPARCLPRRWMNHVHKPKSPNRRNHTSWPKHEQHHRRDFGQAPPAWDAPRLADTVKKSAAQSSIKTRFKTDHRVAAVSQSPCRRACPITKTDCNRQKQSSETVGARRLTQGTIRQGIRRNQRF